MKEEFCSYEISLALKELGFNESCLAYYTTGTKVTVDKDGNLTDFVLLSAKLKGELVGQGSVKNSLFKWLKDNDRTSGELYSLSRSITVGNMKRLPCMTFQFSNKPNGNCFILLVRHSLFNYGNQNT